MNATTRTLLRLQSCEFRGNGHVLRGKEKHEMGAAVHRLRSRLSVQVLHEYDYRKRRFGKESVVPVEDSICSGCHIILSQQTLRLSYGRLIECEHCGRLVYNPGRRRRMHLEVCAA